MSAEFETGFCVKQASWHHLEKLLKEAPATSKEAIVEAGLDWGVEKRNIYWKKQDIDEYYRIPNKVSLVRTSDQKALSIVSDHYKVLQNSEAFDFFDPIVQEGKATYETAGSLCGGRIIWVLANLNKPVEIVKGDQLRRYLLLSNSHGCNKSVQIMVCSTRVVCLNTLNMALASGGAYGIWHHGNMKGEMEKVKGLLGLAEQQFEAKEEVYKAMSTFSVNNSLVAQYITSVLPPANEEATERVKDALRLEQEHIWQLMETGMGADIKGVKGTMWNVYNAFVEHVDYYSSPRVRDRGNFLIFGTGKDMKQRAFDTAVEMMAN